MLWTKKIKWNRRIPYCIVIIGLVITALPNSYCGICLLFLIDLFGCTANPRASPSESIAQTFEESMAYDGKIFVWHGPVLHVLHYRTLFYGYDMLITG